ncbi:MAG: protein HflC [Lysobacteraceae bacterium]|nr:MAG: protein HflC [Xanthomonadaceae bacterium]
MKPLHIIGLAVVALIGMLSVFTVNEAEYAVKFRLGKIVRTDFDPGLYFQVPIYNNVIKFDRRILTLDAPPERVLTSEKKDVIVDAFVKWRIEDPSRYYVATLGDEFRAGQRLTQIIKDGLRGEFARRTLKEVVSGERGDLIESITSNASQVGETLGIQIVDVRIKRIDLPEDVSTSVFNRMRAERSRVANELRSQGLEVSEQIKSDADRQVQVILAEADRDAERIRGEGDAMSAALYAEAYSKDPEFYAFVRSMNAYRKAFRSPDDLIVLDADSEFFKYFKDQSPDASQ